MLRSLVEVVDVIDDAYHVKEIADVLNLKNPVNASQFSGSSEGILEYTYVQENYEGNA